MTVIDRPSVDESLTCAANSSDLTLRPERRGDVDMLIAAGLSPTRIGGALLRLHSEYDGACRARRTSAGDFTPKKLPAEKDKRAVALALAAVQSTRHNSQEAALMLGRLKSLPTVREALTLQLQHWGERSAEDVCASVLRWWLHPTCSCCHGTRFEVVAGTGRLSNRVCKVCRGSGQAAVPGGQAGRRLANHMDSCIEQARRSISRRLRPT